MTEEDAAYYAETMSGAQRKIIALCSPRQSFGYSSLADRLGSAYADVKVAGDFLKAANLATIETTRMGSEFSGSAIFLNERGEQVRQAVAKLESRRS